MVSRVFLVAILGLALFSAGTAYAQSSEGALIFITLEPSARANGMGKTHVAVTDDATAIWWNPAALAFMDDRQATLMHTQLVPDLADDVFYEFFGYSSTVKGLGGIGVSVTYITYGKNEARNREGVSLGEFTPYELAPSFSFGTKLMEDLSLGVNFKFIWSSLAPESASPEGRGGRGTTVAADTGILWRIPKYRMNWGLNFSNIGPNIAYIDQNQSDPLPRSLKVGVGYWPIAEEDHTLVVTADLNKPFVDVDDGPILHLGSEYSLGEYLSGRFGYFYEGWFTPEDLRIDGATFGVGLRYKGFSFDYASVPQGLDLGRRSLFSFNAHF
jgi:hypothetical protein